MKLKEPLIRDQQHPPNSYPLYIQFLNKNWQRDYLCRWQ